MTEAFTEYGIVENTGPWSGLTSEEARRQMAAYAEEHGFGEAGHHVSHQGLGHLAAALLGHADSGDSLPAMRRRAGARRPASGDSAGAHRDHRRQAVRRSKTCPNSST